MMKLGKYDNKYWSVERTRDLLDAALGDPEHLSVLSERKGKLVMRYNMSLGESFIIKFWQRESFGSAIRRFLACSDAHREWRGLTSLSQANVRVPLPLGMAQQVLLNGSYSDAVVMGDIGPNQAAVSHLKQIAANGEESKIRCFNDELLRLTKAIVDQGSLDADHSIVNLVVTPNEELFRIDFELMKVALIPRLRVNLYTKMIVRLLTSYAYAVQPDGERMVQFAKELMRMLSPPALVRRMAFKKAISELEEQRKNLDIDSGVNYLELRRAINRQ